MAPSVLTIDRVAAAVGTCGVAPVQVDWTSVAGTFPTQVTANDGTIVSIATVDPFGVADPSFLGLAFGGTTGALDNPLIMAMDNATNGDYTEIVFRFSRPVAPCFSLLDVDEGNFPTGWRDGVIFTGTNGATTVNLGPGDIVTAPGNAIVGPNEVVGIASVPNNSTDGQVDVTYPSPITQLRIRHVDDSTFTGFQYIGIHDLHWCP